MILDEHCRFLNFRSIPPPISMLNNHQMKFREFLAVLQSGQNHEATHFILGNSSADYDSIMGSLVMAFLLTSASGILHVPIIDCQKQHLQLRFQVVAVLQKYGINDKVFLFKEEFAMRQKKWIFSLYDHNERLQLSDNKIEYVVDHHVLGKCRSRKQLVTLMGSALTLLYYLMHPTQLLKASSDHKDQPLLGLFSQFTSEEKIGQEDIVGEWEVEAILRVGILLDCFNFDPAQAQRWTQFDLHAATTIGRTSPLTLQQFDRINNLKHNRKMLQALTLEQALVRDYKQQKYGKIHCEYSVVGLSPSNFCQHYHHYLAQFTSQKQKSDVYFIMALYKTEAGPLQRQMIYRVKPDQIWLKNQLQEWLQGSGLVREGTIGEWQWWNSKENTLSRKKLHAQLKQRFDELEAKQNDL